jgi:hypothetical protein
MPRIPSNGWSSAGKDTWNRYFNEQDSRIVLQHETRKVRNGEKHYTKLALQIRVFDESDSVDYWTDVVRTRTDGHHTPSIEEAITTLFAELRADIMKGII